MLYSFVKYINPSWYFNLHPKKEVSYFLDFDLMSEKDKDLIRFDRDYSSLAIAKIDAAYQGFQKGIISSTALAVNELNIESTIDDKYRFIKKYFNPFWLYYILIIRLLSFKNPIKEIKGLVKSFEVERVNLFSKISDQISFDSFNSELVRENPLVSIIIPTLNRYSYLKDVLLDLESQSYKKFEVIIIDQSNPYENLFYEKWKLNLLVKQQEEKALWLARNTGIKLSKGNIICLTEDDVRLPADWLENHLKCLDYYKTDISSGVFFPASDKIPKSRNFFKYAEQFATGNVCLFKKVFYKIGLFDRQFEKMRGGDGEFGLRAYLQGIKSISNPIAFCQDVKAPVGGLRQMGSWDSFRPKRFLSPRPIPSVLYYIRKYFGKKAALLTLIINVPPSLLPYRYKKNKFVYFWGIILMVATSPLVLFSVSKSWYQSSKMLKEGVKIDWLD